MCYVAVEFVVLFVDTGFVVCCIIAVKFLLLACLLFVGCNACVRRLLFDC